MRRILPKAVRGIQSEPAAELDADGFIYGAFIYGDGSIGASLFLIFNDDGPQRDRRVIVEFDDFQERRFEGLKIEVGIRHPDAKSLPDSFHHKKTRNMVQRMVKERGVCVVNAQRPGICRPACANGDIMGKSVPHPLRRQRLSLRRLAICGGAQSQPGIAGGVDQPRSGGPRGDGMTADVEACPDPQNERSARVPL